ncbi:MAG: hypothetical protein OHK93_000683 [Ramalina farinacea]|uniref:Transmembrane protein n=1 Tax=Ramalina farinacea TaxID=258253 RepID=A0AA43QFD7_9LECA|nr:hypothetical protein [Ramalina farinacea]
MDPAEPATTISHPVPPSNSILRSNSGYTQRVNQSFSASSPSLPPVPASATRSAPSPSPPFSYQFQPTTLSPPLGQFFINTFLQAFGVAAAIAFGVFAVESVRQAEVANGYAAKALEQARVANEVAMLAICMSGNQTKGALLDGRLASLCAHVSAAGGGVVFPAAATAVFTGAVISSTGPMATTTAASDVPITSSAVASTTAASDVPITSSAVTRTTSVDVSAIPMATSGSSASQKSSPSTYAIIGAVCVTVGGVLIVGLIILCLAKRSNRRARTTPDSYRPSNADMKPTGERRQHGLPSLDRARKAKKSRMSTGENDSLGKERQGAMSRLWRWYRATFLDSTVHTSIS